MGPNLENRVDEAAIRSVIRPVLLWQLRMSELVRCDSKRALFSSPNKDVFSSTQPRIGIVLPRDCPSLPQKVGEDDTANPKKRWP